MATTADYLTQLQTDKQTLVTNLVAKGVEATNDETFTTLVPKVADIETGGGTPTFTGHYDREGLKQIGWTDEDIDYYNTYGVQWNADEDDLFKLTDAEKAGDDSATTRFLPKNSKVTEFNNYYRLMAVPSGLSLKPRMFQNCHNLTSVTQLNKGSITDAGYLFQNCNSLMSISNLDTSNLVNMSDMFNGCKSLQTIPQLDTSKAKNMSGMFESCYSLKTIPLLNTSNVTNMSMMFYNCDSLKTIPSLDTSKVTSMSQMFDYCKSLQTIPQLDTTNVNIMYMMFEYCFSLKTIPQLDTSNNTNMTNMFYSCQSMVSIPKLDCNKVTVVSNCVYNCLSLTDLGGFENLGQAYTTTTVANFPSYKLDLSRSNKLTEQSLINVLTNLYDIKTKGCAAQQVVLGSTNLAKLTSEEGQAALTSATEKGWTIS